MKKLAMLLALVVALGGAAPALAQQSVVSGYGGQARNDSQVLGEVGEVTPAKQKSAPSTGQPAAQVAPAAQVTPAQPESASGQLPFTGLDVALIALGGVFLVGIGLTVRRLARDPHTPA